MMVSSNRNCELKRDTGRQLLTEFSFILTQEIENLSSAENQFLFVIEDTRFANPSTLPPGAVAQSPSP
jgi:hypothetical protein